MRLRRLLLRAAPLALAWALATSARAAEEHGEHAAASPLLIVYHALGLAVLIGVLVYFARTPVQTFLRDRSDTLRRQLETARLALERAEASSREANARLARLAEENEALVRGAAEQAEVEKARAIERAREAAERVREEARRSADQEIERARGELQREAARLATSLAGEIVRQNMTPQDDERLLGEFVERVGRTS